MLKRLLEWDRDTFIYLNSLGIEDYDAFWSVITRIITWVPLFALFLYLLFKSARNQREAFYRLGTVVLLVLFIMTLMTLTKEWVARLRPNNEEAINTLIRILKHPTDYSFFSGHAASSFAITTWVYLVLRRKWPWLVLAYIWPILFSFSRIYVGVHYPIDLMVGALIGLCSAFAFYWGYGRAIARDIG